MTSEQWETLAPYLAESWAGDVTMPAKDLRALIDERANLRRLLRGAVRHFVLDRRATEDLGREIGDALKGY